MSSHERGFHDLTEEQIDSIDLKSSAPMTPSEEIDHLIRGHEVTPEFMAGKGQRDFRKAHLQLHGGGADHAHDWTTEPCGASTYLEGYGMVHCDQPKGHEHDHCGPLSTEHYWKQEVED